MLMLAAIDMIPVVEGRFAHVLRASDLESAHVHPQLLLHFVWTGRQCTWRDPSELGFAPNALLPREDQIQH